MFKRAHLTADEIIRRNFRNSQGNQFSAIGIYPLRDGNLTRFIAMDFDSASWENDARYILKTARSIGIPMLWEISCSGNGAHLWIFFSEDIQASKARKLAFCIIDKTRERYPSLTMDSYDRLFPSQDRLSKDGIGNLILMPLISSAAVHGRTVFLDDNQIPIPLDRQLQYLARVHKLSAVEVDAYLSAAKAGCMDNSDFILSDDDINPGWIRNIPKLESDDFIGEIILYLSSGISFDKRCLSTRAQEALRRLSTIYNPEYYKYVARHDGYRGTLCSRIPLYEENDRVLKLPRGMFPKGVRILQSIGIRYSIEDYRVCGTDLKASFLKALRPEQEKALSGVLSKDIGLLACAPGFGKTVVAFAVITARRERTLIIVPTTALLEQWVSGINEFMKISESDSAFHTPKGRKRKVPGIMGGGKDRLSGIIDVATLQSLCAKIDGGNLSWISSYGMVIVDECHHIAAEKAREILRNMRSRYVLGLSATVKRADGLESIVYAECGSVVFSVTTSQMAYQRGIRQEFIPHFLETAYRNEKNFTEVLNRISADSDRSFAIAENIADACRKGRRILVLSRRKIQNNLLSEAFETYGIRCTVLDGEMSSEYISSSLSKLKGEEHIVLIGTDKLLGEGVDIPVLDTLFLVSPFMQLGIITQCAGRLLRISHGKSDVTIHDYVDYRIPMFRQMFARRISIYRKLGYISGESTETPYPKIIFTQDDYLEKLIQDIEKARTRIIISASFVAVSAVTESIISAVSDASIKGVDVEFRMKSEGIFPAVSAMFSKYLISPRTAGNPQNFIVIDMKISWYGQFNPMGQGNISSEDGLSILRILDEEAAVCLSADDLVGY